MIIENFSQDQIDRFLSFIYFPSDSNCWIWTGCFDKDGYGLFGANYKSWRVPRVSHELFNGPITADDHVCHRCDWPPCLNPDHLFLGSPMQNIHDMMDKGRAKCQNDNRHFIRLGHLNPKAKLTSVQVLEIYHSSERTGTLRKRFAVSKYTIQHIRTGIHWSHVTGHKK